MPGDLTNIDPNKLGQLLARVRQLDEDEGRGQRVGGYQLLGKLGEGASGTVWRARQLATGRLVALKVLNGTGLGSFKARRRFEREAELTGRLAHPNIGRLYDSGVWQGMWFHAMELIDGLPLDRYVAGHGLEMRSILQLMAQVCRAVQHAHERGVIHRDLKPSNILVSSDGQPHVLDFGLARAVEESRRGLTISLAGEVAGTLGFMSPEQAAGYGDAVETRGDVYSLGAILYLLLTGRTPHDLSGSRLAVARRIAEQEPPRPRTINPRIDGEMEAVLLKAMAINPARRYATAGELADDLDRYLRGDPLSARPATLAYFVGRRVRRHRLPISLAAATCAALVSMLIYTYARVAGERNVSIEQTRIAREQRQIADVARTLAENRLADGLLVQADSKGVTMRWVDAKVLYEEARQKLQQLHRSDFAAELGLLKGYQYGPPPLNEFPGSEGQMYATAISNDGTLVAAGGSLGQTWVWDSASGRMVCGLPLRPQPIRTLAFSPDGAQLLSGDSGGFVSLFDVQKRALRWSFRLGGQVLQVAWSPDGRYVAGASHGGGEVVLESTDGQVVSRPLPSGAIAHCIAFSADGEQCAAGNAYSLWTNATADSRRATWHIGGNLPWAVAFSPDGRFILSGCERVPASTDKLQLWNASTHELIRTFPTDQSIDSISFSSDSKLAYTAGEGVIQVRDVQSGQLIRTIWADQSGFSNVSLNPGRQLAVATGEDNVPRLWDLAGASQAPKISLGRPLYCVAISPDDRRVFAGGDEVAALVVSDGLAESESQCPHVAQAAAFAADGGHVLFGLSTGELGIADVRQRRNVQWIGRHDADVRTVIVSPDGKQAITANGNSAFLWELPREIKVAEARAGATLAAGAVFARGGNEAIGITVHGRIARWLLDASRETDGPALDVPHDLTSNAVFLHEGRQVAAGCGTQIGLWEVATGRRLATLRGHFSDVIALCASPDGKWLASGSSDNSVRVWNAESGRQLQFFDCGATIRSLAWSHDGHRLYAAGNDGVLRKFDFSIPRQYRDFAARLPPARRVLQTQSHDANAIGTLSKWYHFRGREDLAKQLERN